MASSTSGWSMGDSGRCGTTPSRLAKGLRYINCGNPIVCDYHKPEIVPSISSLYSQKLDAPVNGSITESTILKKKNTSQDISRCQQSQPQPQPQPSEYEYVQALIPSTFKISNDRGDVAFPAWSSYEIMAVESPNLAPGQFIRFPPNDPDNETPKGTKLNAAGHPTKRGRNRPLSAAARRAAALLHEIQSSPNSPFDPETVALLFDAIRREDEKSFGICKALWNSFVNQPSQEKAILTLADFKHRLKLQKLLIDEQADKLSGAYNSIKNQHLQIVKQEADFHNACSQLQHEIKQLAQDNQLLAQDRSLANHVIMEIREAVTTMALSLAETDNQQVREGLRNLVQQLESVMAYRARLNTCSGLPVDDGTTSSLNDDAGVIHNAGNTKKTPRKLKKKKMPLHRRKGKKTGAKKRNTSENRKLRKAPANERKRKGKINNKKTGRISANANTRRPNKLIPQTPKLRRRRIPKRISTQ